MSGILPPHVQRICLRARLLLHALRARPRRPVAIAPRRCDLVNVTSPNLRARPRESPIAASGSSTVLQWPVAYSQARRGRYRARPALPMCHFLHASTRGLWLDLAPTVEGYPYARYGSRSSRPARHGAVGGLVYPGFQDLGSRTCRSVEGSALCLARRRSCTCRVQRSRPLY
jgi:hypothetical protein